METINRVCVVGLTEREEKILEEARARKGMTSLSGVIRLWMRLGQVVDQHMENGSEVRIRFASGDLMDPFDSGPKASPTMEAGS